MSQRQKSNGGKSAKRKANAASESPAESAATDNRAVRQRAEQMQPAVATSTASAATPAAPAAAVAASPSPTTLAAVLSFLRLAVVERQLVMQGLDLGSLARLASSCKQMRGEAMNKEAGRFLKHPDCDDALSDAHCMAEFHPAHASPLFCKHAPMSLRCSDDSAESLLPPAAQFSRVVTFSAGDTLSWAQEQMLLLLSLPCMQHVTELNLRNSSQWIGRPLVQTALLGLPRLKTFQMAVGPETKLLPSAVALASKLLSLAILVRGGLLSYGSLRALAPSLDRLSFHFCEDHSPLPRDLPWCLPLTLTHLSLWGADVPRNVSRPFVKALFSRTPLLSSLQFSFVSIEAILRGLLDAGIAALPALCSVEFEEVAPFDCSLGIDPDPLEPLFRRFVYQFPQVTVCIRFSREEWPDSEELRVVQMRYVGWSSVELSWSDREERIGGPLIPHSSDKDSGSDVEELEEPLPVQQQ